MRTPTLPQRPPAASAGVAAFGPGVHAGHAQTRSRADTPPTSSGGHRLKTILLAAVLAALLVSAAGCGGGGGGGGDREERAESPTGDEAQERSPVSEPQVGGDAAEPEDDGFVASAEGSGGEAGAADRIEGVRFQIFGGYERLLIAFGWDGGSAGVPRWSVESPEQGGYVRLRLPDVASTATAHEDLVGSVLNELYVVSDSDGGLFADVFAMHEFRYRITELPESGQLAVDFRGIRKEINFPPTTSDKAVVVQPREAEEVTSPITVEGYSRVPGSLVNVSLIDRDGEVISSTEVRAEGDAGAWHPYEATLEFSGHEGLATLRVGGMSPRVGPRSVTFEGTQTEIFLE